MAAKQRTIEVDAKTADTLEAHAAESGVSVADLVADLVTDMVADLAREQAPLVVAADQIAELDRRWEKVVAGEPTDDGDEVVRWLRTWGTPAFRPWHER